MNAYKQQILKDCVFAEQSAAGGHHGPSEADPNLDARFEPHADPVQDTAMDEIPDNLQADFDSDSENESAGLPQPNEDQDSEMAEPIQPDKFAAIQMWADLVAYPGADGISAQLLRRTRDISIPESYSDARNRRPIGMTFN